MSLSKEQIIELIASYQAREISDEGITELQEWLKESPGNSDEFAKYIACLKEAKMLGKMHEVNSANAWDNINKNISKSKNKSRSLAVWIPYAAAVVVLFVVGYFMINEVKDDYDFSKTYSFSEIAQAGSKKAVLTLENGMKMHLEEMENRTITELDGTRIQKDSSNSIAYDTNSSKVAILLYNKIEIPRGGEYSLVLSDGTKVWLNSESSLRYPVRFIGKKRKVELKGEAYFEVAHNKEMPFFVTTHDTEIKVLGTKFNISSYEDEEFVETTLVHGSVLVSSLGKSKLLSPGDQAVQRKGESVIEINEVNTDLYTSWTHGVFRFEDESLEEICMQLSRWYNVEFFFTENKYRNLRITGAAKRNKSIDFALNMIEKITGVKFAVKENKIIVGG